MASTELPPSILNAVIQGIVDQLRLPFVYIIVNVAFAAMLLPMLIALVYFTHKRSSPVFICAVICVLLGMLQGIAIVGTTDRDVLNPLSTNPPSVQVINSLSVGLPVLSVDMLLLCRVLAVVPPSKTSPSMLFAVYTFPILSKVARLVLIIISAIYASKASNLTATAYDASKIQVQMIQSVYFITAADNAYSSAIFLWKLQISAFRSQAIMRFTDGKRGDSFTSHIRTLFWLCGTNFIFPVPLYIAQVVLIRTQPGSAAFVLVTTTNNYVGTICGVFATVWSTGISRANEASYDSLHFRHVNLRVNEHHTNTNGPDIELSSKAREALSVGNLSQERGIESMSKFHNHVF